MAVDFRLEEGLVKGIDPYLEPAAAGILSNDGYFKRARDIDMFQKEWEENKPDRNSVVTSVSRDSADADAEYFAVYATEGRNAKGFDSPIVTWVSVFSRDSRTGEWEGDEFLSLQ